MKEISSVSNELIVNFKKLKLKKYRKEQGLYLLEGRRLVTDALTAGAPIQTLLVLNTELEAFAQAIISAQNAGADILSVSRNIIEALSETQAPEGIMAVSKIHTLPFRTGGLLVALDNLQDPGNMGTIIRTCDAAGIGGLLLGEGCAELYNPKVVRSAMGSLFSVPVKNCFSLTEELALLKSSGYTVAAAALGGEPFFQASRPEKTVLIIGNEGNGISRETLKQADITLTLPMRGGAQSLNASIAAELIVSKRARLVFKASLPPFKREQLPLFKQSELICTSASGRDSNITPITPMGQDTLYNSSPSSSLRAS